MQQSLSDKLDFFSEIISLVAIEDEIIKLFITCLKKCTKRNSFTMFTVISIVPLIVIELIYYAFSTLFLINFDKDHVMFYG